MLTRSMLAGAGAGVAVTGAPGAGAGTGAAAGASEVWMYATKVGSLPTRRVGRVSRCRRWRSNSWNSLAAPEIELLTVRRAMTSAR